MLQSSSLIWGNDEKKSSIYHIFFDSLGLLLICIALVRMNIFVAILRFQGPPFTYRYGFSFLLYVSGFITTEIAGTYAIFLYISWHQRELVRRDSRRKNYGVGSISFFSTIPSESSSSGLIVENLDRINIRLRISIMRIAIREFSSDRAPIPRK